MLDFYDVDLQYINYLKTIDNHIPDIVYTSTNKFVCGIVLIINDIEYVAPVSSNIKPMKTSFPILDKNGKTVSTIRFSFMFPSLPSVIHSRSINTIAKTNPKYANLMRMELHYCQTHESEILAMAQKIYKIGCNKNHYLNKVCCDFLRLEQEYQNYTFPSG